MSGKEEWKDYRNIPSNIFDVKENGGLRQRKMSFIEGFQSQEAFEQISVPKGRARKVEDKVEDKGGDGNSLEVKTDESLNRWKALN